MAGNNRNNISQLRTPYSQQLADNDAKRQRLLKVRKKRFYIIVSVFAVLTIFFGVQIFQAHHNLQNIQAQTVQKQTKLKHVKAKNKQLNQQVKLLNDDTYLEKIIRQKYFYAKSGETVYNFTNQSQDK